MLESFLPLVKFALSEDVGTGDVTTLNAVPANVGARAVIMAKEPGVVSGLEIAQMTFREVDPALQFKALVNDGARIESGTVLAKITGLAGSIMTAERTALNFVMRMCGVATLTRRFVDAIAGTGAAILDTRKTTPGLRFLEKYAVQCGGGQNHRLALWDMYLVKDNHIRAAKGVTNAINAILRTRRDLLLEVEVESPDQLREALRPEVDRILVDNRPVAEVRRAVEELDRWCAHHPSDSPRKRPGARRWPEIEVSGGITLANARAYAETGVDYLSVGALTHSAPSLDLSLEIEELAEPTFDRARFQSRLATRWLGRHLVAHASVESTNDAAWEALAAGAADGTVVVADAQTRGRGRAGRPWHLAPGKGLALSALLLFGRERRAAGVLPLAAGLALSLALERLGVPTELKWPNDLLAGGRKLSGILCESRRPALQGVPGAGEAAVVGVGVNVAERARDFPPEIRARSTSLALEGADLDRETVGAEFLNALEPLWASLGNGGRDGLLDAWRGRASFWGSRVRVRTSAGELSGIARTLDADGGLVLDLDSGGATTVVAGDLECAPVTERP